MSPACLMVLGLAWPWELFLTYISTKFPWMPGSQLPSHNKLQHQSQTSWSVLGGSGPEKVGLLAHLSSTAAGTCLSAFLDHFWFQSVLGHTARCLIHFPHLTVWINLCGQCVVNDNNSVGEMDVMRSILFWIFLSHFKCKVILSTFMI